MLCHAGDKKIQKTVKCLYKVFFGIFFDIILVAGVINCHY